MYKLYFGVDCNGNRMYSKDVYKTIEEAETALSQLQEQSPNLIVEVVQIK